MYPKNDQLNFGKHSKPNIYKKNTRYHPFCQFDPVKYKSVMAALKSDADNVKLCYFLQKLNFTRPLIRKTSKHL